jgi:HTH-type transcriptional regulator/antitoxin HipB
VDVATAGRYSSTKRKRALSREKTEARSRTRTDDPFLTSSEGAKGRTLRTSEDVGDPAVSISCGPNAAQEVSGASLHHSIRRLLKARREALSLSQRELAQRAGISHSTISRIERGRHLARLRTLERIAEALDVRLLVRF